MYLDIYKKQLSKELEFNVEDITLIETEEFEDDEYPYYYLFVYKGKRYKYIFGKLVEENIENDK